MTTFLLVRHGTADETGRILSGRRPVHLNAQGRAQADIRAALAQCLGMPLDLILRLDVDPVSVSVLEFRPWGARLRRFNSQGTWPERE